MSACTYFNSVYVLGIAGGFGLLTCMPSPAGMESSAFYLFLIFNLTVSIQSMAQAILDLLLPGKLCCSAWHHAASSQPWELLAPTDSDSEQIARIFFCRGSFFKGNAGFW